MIDVELDAGAEWDVSIFGLTQIEKAVDAAVRVAGNSVLSDPPVPISVSVKLSDNAELHALNREWRDKDKPTNVLSFPMLDEDEIEAIYKMAIFPPPKSWSAISSSLMAFALPRRRTRASPCPTMRLIWSSTGCSICSDTTISRTTKPRRWRRWR